MDTDLPGILTPIPETIDLALEAVAAPVDDVADERARQGVDLDGLRALQRAEDDRQWQSVRAWLVRLRGDRADVEAILTIVSMGPRLLGIMDYITKTRQAYRDVLTHPERVGRERAERRAARETEARQCLGNRLRETQAEHWRAHHPQGGGHHGNLA